MPDNNIESRVIALEQDAAVLKEHIQGSLEAINDKLQMLLDGRGGNCIQQNARISRLEETCLRIDSIIEIQLKKREEQLAVKCDKKDFDRLDAAVTWIWRTIIVSGLGILAALIIEYIKK